jgi:hypothetical protein
MDARPIDHREFERYPIELPVQLQFHRCWIDEKTVNIGSGGMLMTCSQEGFSVGMYINTRIRWPLMREGTTRVLLRHGRIVRRESGRIAMQWKRSQKLLTLTAPEAE